MLNSERCEKQKKVEALTGKLIEVKTVSKTFTPTPIPPTPNPTP